MTPLFSLPNVSPMLIIFGFLFSVAVIMSFLGYTEMKRRQKLNVSPTKFVLTDKMLDGILVHTLSFDTERRILLGRVLNPPMELKRLLLNDVIHIHVDDPGDCLNTNCEIVDGKLQKVNPHRRTPTQATKGHRAQTA